MSEGAFRAHWFVPAENQDFKNLTDAELHAYVVRHAHRYGVQRFYFSMPADVRLDDRPRGAPWRRRPWRPHGLNDTTFQRNLLWLKSIELLWNESAALMGTGRYSHVVLVRSDIVWVDDLLLEDFREANTVYSRGFGTSYCGATSNFTTAEEEMRLWLPDDRAIVFGGQAAEFLLPRLWTDYYHNPRPELDSPPVAGTEHWMLSLARHYRISWEVTGSGGLVRFPFFAGLHVIMWSGGPLEAPFFCLRGGSRASLEHPVSPCISPGKVHYIFCEDGLQP